MMCRGQGDLQKEGKKRGGGREKGKEGRKQERGERERGNEGRSEKEKSLGMLDIGRPDGVRNR